MKIMNMKSSFWIKKKFTEKMGFHQTLQKNKKTLIKFFIKFINNLLYVSFFIFHKLNF